MKKLWWMSCLCSSLLFGSTCWAKITAMTELTPAAIPDGQLPNGYSRILYNVPKGYETYVLKLPTLPDDGDYVLIAGNGATSHVVLGDKLDFPQDRISIQHCGYCSFTYRKETGRWSIFGIYVKYYSSVRHAVPVGNWNYAVYDIRPGDQHPRIGLPSTANSGAVLFVRSSSQQDSQIDPAGLLYASTAVVKYGDVYKLRYIDDFKKWAIEEAPERTIDLGSAHVRPSAPRSIAVLTDARWIPTLRLPAEAGDRDRITVRSSTSRSALIDGTGIEAKGIFGLARGQEYTFMYIADKKHWVVLDAPDTIHTATQLKDGVMPAPATPRTIYVSDRQSYLPNIHLPKPAGNKGARIVFKGEAINPFNVHAPAADGSSKLHSVHIGETPAFVSDGKAWIQETITIDVLGVYSDKAAAIYGDELMRTRLLDGIQNTNHALENSGVHFRMRLVGIRKLNAPSLWTDIDVAASSLGKHPQINRWRDHLKADLVYYEGAEKTRTDQGSDHCGLTPSVGPWEGSFAAAGAATCNTKVMRHELGHLVGLLDGPRPWDYGNVGYPITHTIMAGNGTAFYSTPERYSRNYGMPMGVEDTYDAVRALNLNAPTVSAFR